MGAHCSMGVSRFCMQSCRRATFALKQHFSSHLLKLRGTHSVPGFCFYVSVIHQLVEFSTKGEVSGQQDC